MSCSVVGADYKQNSLHHNNVMCWKLSFWSKHECNTVIITIISKTFQKLKRTGITGPLHFVRQEAHICIVWQIGRHTSDWTCLCGGHNVLALPRARVPRSGFPKSIRTFTITPIHDYSDKGISPQSTYCECLSFLSAMKSCILPSPHRSVLYKCYQVRSKALCTLWVELHKM